MQYLIQKHHRYVFKESLREMHKKRYEVFYKELGWDVPVKDGLETDQYDIDSAIYIVSHDIKHGVVGGMRLLPTTGSNMIKNTFPHLVNDENSIPNDPKIWEITRFFYSPPKEQKSTIGLARKGTLELFVGMLEFGITWKLNGFVVLTDLRIEKMINRIGWELKRIGSPVEFNGQRYVVGIMPVSEEILKRVRNKTSINSPVLMSHSPVFNGNSPELNFDINSPQNSLLNRGYSLQEKLNYQELGMGQ